MLRIIQQLKDSFKTSGHPSDADLSTKSRSSQGASAHRSHRSVSWVIPGKLAVGGFPGVEDGVELAHAGIQVMLSLCAESEKAVPEAITHQFEYLRYFLPDSHYDAPLTVERLVEAVEIVHRSIENRQPIYVHCLAGIERSPTVCIAYLCRYRHLELWEAIHWLKHIHPDSRPTPSQVQALQAYVRQHAVF